MKPLSEAILVVCGIVRNAERGLKRNIPIIKTLCGMAKDYHVVVYEMIVKIIRKVFWNLGI